MPGTELATVVPRNALEREGQDTRLVEAHAALARVQTAEDAKEVQDAAQAIRRYAAESRWALEVQNEWAEVSTRAARLVGKFLDEQWEAMRSSVMPGQFPPKYAEWLVERYDLSRPRADFWRRLSRIPDDEFEQYIARCKEQGRPITNHALKAMAPKLGRVRWSYDESVKAEARRLYEEMPSRNSGKRGGIRQIAAELDVSPPTIWTWLHPEKVAESERRQKERRRQKREAAKRKAFDRKVRELRKAGDPMGEAWSLLNRAWQQVQHAVDQAETQKRKAVRSAIFEPLHEALDRAGAAINQRERER